MSDPDLPARIVLGATRLFLVDRREWAAAMEVELEYLRDRRSRWRFALGCARAALFAPRHPSARSAGAAIVATLVAGVVGCLATTAYVLKKWPHASADVSQATWCWFGGSLLVYVTVALRPLGALVAHASAVRRGALAGCALFLTAGCGRTVIDALVPPENGDGIVGLFLTVTVVGTFVAAPFAAARNARSLGAGLTAALWTGLVCSILAFNGDLLATLTGFNLEVHMRHSLPAHVVVAPETFLGKHIGSHLASAIESLRTLPLLALFFGAIGAAAGRKARIATAAGAIESP